MVKIVMRFLLYARGGGGGGGKGSQKSLRGGTAPRSNPLSFYIPIPFLTEKRYPFCIPYFDKWYPFHIPTLRTLHPFQLL